ncbi:Sulfate permease family protein 3 [Toxocara canis]|uniref:Sulfate permease family protein 3 n=1 Tax=Toxocara canis TaxID=6265 RepID=A0A0B2VFW5_TOXCA|nr:Sulfate permease family protein 3 [Toxocara canis]
MDDGLREGRAVMNQEDFDEKYGYHPPISTTCHRAKKAARKCIDPCTSGRKFLKAVTGCVPILEWLPKYNFKGYLVRDIIGGLTTGIMHVPQGIAYSVLSGVAPVYGLYSSFFPVLFYMIFGTSRHTSIGSFAVVALMSGIANEQIMSKYVTTTNSTMNATEDTTLTPIQVASTLTFALGMIQFATGLLRLEFLTDYFSDQLVAGFTTGAACHVFTAQLDDIFGLTVPKVSGPGYIFRRIYDIIIRIPHANVCTVITSAIGIAFLYVGKDFISPFVNKRSPVKIPIPYELILLIMFAAISYLLNLNERYGMIIVGDIPAGVPEPQLPNISILSDCLIGAAGIAAVTIAVHISMAKMLAKKMKYKIDARQELYALGLSAMLGGLFPIYPVSTALGRTMVNVESGSKTQLSSLFSCLLLLTIILWLGPLLETLPMCILAVIILMALRAMFRKLSDLGRLWPTSKIDFWVWFIAFISTVAISVVEGLAISIAVALLTIIFRSQWPKSATLARIPDTNDFKDPRKYTAALPCPNICIFRFDSALLFVNAERFKRSITEAMSVWELDSNVKLQKAKALDEKSFNDDINVANNGNPPDKNYLIIDCSCIAFIDYTGATALKEVANDARSRHVELFLAATTANVRQSLEVSGFFSTVSKKYFFPTISDAFHFATANSASSVSEVNACEDAKHVSNESMKVEVDAEEAAMLTTTTENTCNNGIV